MTSVEGVRRLMRPHLAALQGYVGVKPPEETARMVGIVPERVVKLDGNENVYGCSPRVQQALGRHPHYNLYPDPEQGSVRQALAEYVGMGPEHIVAGAGADELIDLILRLFLDPGDGVVECDPTFGMYSFCTQVCGGRVVPAPRDDRFDVDVEGVRRAAREGAKVVFIASPNNPTGNATPREDVVRILETGLIVVVDETYFEFYGQTVGDLVPRYANLIVLRSLSKWAGLAGLRIGYGIMAPPLVQTLLTVKAPYNITRASEMALLASLEDRDLLLSNVQKLVQERKRLFGLLQQMDGIEPLPSEGNFLLCRVGRGRGRQMHQGLARQGVFVRYFDTPRLRDCLRISVGRPEHTDRLLEALRSVL